LFQWFWGNEGAWMAYLIDAYNSDAHQPGIIAGNIDLDF
jgi:hypothetical protein